MTNYNKDCKEWDEAVRECKKAERRQRLRTIAKWTIVILYTSLFLMAILGGIYLRLTGE